MINTNGSDTNTTKPLLKIKNWLDFENKKGQSTLRLKVDVGNDQENQSGPNKSAEKCFIFRTDASHTAGAFVKGRQASSEVGGVAAVGGHFRETPGDLTQRLGPTGRGVGHHGHVVAHVSEVLAQSDAGVDGGLAGGHGHVTGVGHQARALHDGLHLAVDFHRQFGEVAQHFGHFVTAFPAADVDDDITVGEFRQRLGDDSFAAPESPRNGGRSTLKKTPPADMKFKLKVKTWLIDWLID